MTEVQYKLRIYDYANSLLNLSMGMLITGGILGILGAILNNGVIYILGLSTLIIFCFSPPFANRRRVVIELANTTIPTVYLEERNYFLNRFFPYRTKYVLTRKGKLGIYYKVERGYYNAT